MTAMSPHSAAPPYPDPGADASEAVEAGAALATPEAGAAEANWLRLDRQICFSLHAASRAFNGVYRVILKDLGLTYPQYLVMLVLWEEGALPVKRLGAHLRLDSGTLSPLLKRLETAGLVHRERSARDERSVEVRLTEEGTALRERALRVPRRIVTATGFELEEIRELKNRLDVLTAALDSAAAQEDPDAGEQADTVRGE
ncbi:MarR family transcriptional regulator [Streptomyces sp. NPDC006172]|uniref:MarR family winged helix-turn-helix transcriptional regulator n=1 Tax=Streptomyces sp. NPDC006172 TaxID=3154470 RepID=UPI0033F28D7F